MIFRLHLGNVTPEDLYGISLLLGIDARRLRPDEIALRDEQVNFILSLGIAGHSQVISTDSKLKTRILGVHLDHLSELQRTVLAAMSSDAKPQTIDIAANYLLGKNAENQDLPEEAQLRLPDAIAVIVWQRIFNHPNSSTSAVFLACKVLIKELGREKVRDMLLKRFNEFTSKAVSPNDLFFFGAAFEKVDANDCAKTIYSAIVTTIDAKYDIYEPAQKGLDRMDKKHSGNDLPELCESLRSGIQKYLASPISSVVNWHAAIKRVAATPENLELNAYYERAVRLEAEGKQAEAIAEYVGRLTQLGTDVATRKKALAELNRIDVDVANELKTRMKMAHVSNPALEGISDALAFLGALDSAIEVLQIILTRSESADLNKQPWYRLTGYEIDYVCSKINTLKDIKEYESKSSEQRLRFAAGWKAAGF